MTNKILPVCTISLCFALIFLSGCNNNEFETEIKSVNNLIEKLDSAEAIFNEIDTAHYQVIADTISSNLNWITRSYKQSNDTMDRETAMFISDYRGSNKVFTKMDNTYSEISAEIEFSKKQLQELKHDLEEEALTAILANKYLVQEGEAVRAIMQSVSSLSIGLKRSDEAVVKHTAKMDSLKSARSVNN